MKIFTKWFIVNSVIATSLILVTYTGTLQMMIRSDVSLITLLILIVLCIVSIICGKLSLLVDRNKITNRELQRKLDIVRFISENLTVFGLAGTLVGMAVMLYGTLNASQDIQTIINQLKIGSATAFYTTLMGLFGNFCLNLQVLILDIKPVQKGKINSE